eukprot:UN28198
MLVSSLSVSSMIETLVVSPTFVEMFESSLVISSVTVETFLPSFVSPKFELVDSVSQHFILIYNYLENRET